MMNVPVPLIIFEDSNAEGFWKAILRRLLNIEFYNKKLILNNVNFDYWIFKKLKGSPNLNNIEAWKEKLIGLGASRSTFLVLIIDKDNFVRNKIDLNQWINNLNQTLNSIRIKIFYIIEYCVESLIACDLDVFTKINIKIPDEYLKDLKERCNEKFKNRHCPKSTINAYLKQYANIKELNTLILKQIGENITVSNIIDKNESFLEFKDNFKQKIKEFYNLL